MGKSQRNKGRRGQTEAVNMLKDRDWQVIQTTSGIMNEDVVATDPGGCQWSVEVKNHKIIDIYRFRRQAIEQANKRKLPWMLMLKIPGGWLIMRKNETPIVWK